MGVDYAKQQAEIVDPKQYASYPMEIWHARDGIKTYREHDATS